MSGRHYDTLGIAPVADIATIERAFQVRLAECAPNADEARAAIFEAFHTLSNPDKRAAYDRQMAGPAQPATAPAGLRRDRPKLAIAAGVLAAVVAAGLLDWLMSELTAVAISLLSWGSIDERFLGQFQDAPLAALASAGVDWNGRRILRFAEFDMASNVAEAVIAYGVAVWVAGKISKSAKERHIALTFGLVCVLLLLLELAAIPMLGYTDDRGLEVFEWAVFIASLFVTYKKWWGRFRKKTPAA